LGFKDAMVPIEDRKRRRKKKEKKRKKAQWDSNPQLPPDRPKSNQLRHLSQEKIDPTLGG